jgi:aspartate racemase
MSWESSAQYYRLINQATREPLEGLHSADCVLRSVDFPEIEALQRLDAWPKAGKRQAGEAGVLEAARSGLLVLCTNTMQKVADMVSSAVGIPLVQIADATADAVRAAALTTVALIATADTMEQNFYVGPLHDRHWLSVLVPDPDERRLVHNVIYDELLGGISDASRRAYRSVIANLVARGAQRILLGCTEIGLLIGPPQTRTCRSSPPPSFTLNGRSACPRARRRRLTHGSGQQQTPGRASTRGHGCGSGHARAPGHGRPVARNDRLPAVPLSVC